MFGIYHRRDLDGVSSGAILRSFFNDIELIPYDYGEPLEIPRLGEPVIMVDVSLPMPKMYELAKATNFQLTWVDHHKSAIEAYRDYIGDGENFLTPVLKIGVAACRLLWEHLSKAPVPSAIKFLSDYDVWNNKIEWYWEDVILPFQYGMRAICIKPEDFPRDLIIENTARTPHLIEKTITVGKSVIGYITIQDEKLCASMAFEAIFSGFKAICLNTHQFSSQTFKSVYNPERHALMIAFSFDGKLWKVSMYTTHDIDCSALAKARGGGGHQGAAGFAAKSFSAIGLEIIER